ncbi:MAG TPA: ubiquitin-like domain-containing protein [Propionibacteriaceae bacterium]|nr:ubiquitin-like domain-containing protein [Propionibacteriaceae bacterium]
MKKQTIGLIASTTAVLGIIGSGTAVAAADKSVTLTVDGISSTVHTFGGTVSTALAKKGITIGEHDVVVPAASSALTNGEQIVVRYGRPLTLTLDGHKETVWVTATSLSDALVQAGIHTAADAQFSINRSTPLGRQGLSLTITTPQQVTVQVDGKKTTFDTTAATVHDVLASRHITLGKLDVVSPSQNTAVSDGTRIVVKRVSEKKLTTTRSVPFATEKTNDSSLLQGTTKVTRTGKNGEQTIVTVETYTDGKLTASKVISTTTSTKPVSQLVSVGTKRPAPAPAPTPSASTSASTSSSGGAINLANAAMWDRIAQCESSGNWSINTGNGYYGGLQFDIRTWLGAGGGQFAPRADLASRAEQITIANRVYASRGLSPWSCAYAA